MMAKFAFMSVRVLAMPVLLAVAVLCGGCYNFYAVKEGQLYRAAQPLEEDLSAMIEAHGIRSVLRLNGGSPGAFWYDEGQRAASNAGVAFYQVGMSAGRFPTRDELTRLWKVFESAEYPLLIHCREGSDRTGLAAAIWILRDGGGVEEAREQLRFFPYGHTGLFGTGSLRVVISMFEPWHGLMSFGEWAMTVYEQPEPGSDAVGLVAAQRRLAKEHGTKAAAGP